MKKIVFMFSGQGSQYYQMGKKLFDNEASFKKYMTQLDKIIYSMNGISVLEEVFDSGKQKTEVFNNIVYTHPAIFMVEYSLANLLIEEGIIPDYLLGTSMGELVSAVLAGVIELKEGFRVLIKQAEAFQTYCQKGGMVAVLSNPELYYNSQTLYQNSEIAAVNYDSHFVVSAGFDGIRLIEDFLRKNSIPFHKLPVDFGFHSHSIDPAAKYYQEVLNSCMFKNAEIPMVSCLDGSIIRKISEAYFWAVVRNPIEFVKAIKTLEELGDYVYIDLGPSGTLANLTKHNLLIGSQSECIPIITPFNNELKNLEKVRKILCNKKYS